MPGICKDCAPPGLQRKHSIKTPLDVSHLGDLRSRTRDYWGAWCRDCAQRGKCRKLCKPLQDRLRGRMRRRQSVETRPFTDLSDNQQKLVYGYLYAEPTVKGDEGGIIYNRR